MVVVIVVMGSKYDLGLEFQWPGICISHQEVLLSGPNKPVHRILLDCALSTFRAPWFRAVALNHGFTLETKKILIPR